MNRLYFLFLFTLISCSNPNQIGVVKNSDDLSLKLTTFINQYVDESYESLDSIFSDSIHINLNNRTYNSISKLESGLKLYHNVYSDILIDSQSLCTFYLDDGSIKTFQKVNFITKNKINQNIGSIRAFFEYKWSDGYVVELSVVFDSETINKEVKFYKNSLKNLPIGN
jgi:hypothetical protein